MQKTGNGFANFKIFVVSGLVGKGRGLGSVCVCGRGGAGNRFAEIKDSGENWPPLAPPICLTMPPPHPQNIQNLPTAMFINFLQ